MQRSKTILVTVAISVAIALALVSTSLALGARAQAQGTPAIEDELILITPVAKTLTDLGHPDH